MGNPRHDPETVELGLRLTVLSGGNTSRAASLMLSEGKPVDAKTLARWKDHNHAHRYEQLIDEIRRELDTEIKDTSSVIASQAQAVEAQLIKELGSELHEIPARDKARAVQSLAQTASTHVQIQRLLSEKPTSIVETRPPSEILAELRELGVIEAEVVEED
jgi:hypothetical protein